MLFRSPSWCSAGSSRLTLLGLCLSKLESVCTAGRALWWNYDGWPRRWSHWSWPPEREKGWGLLDHFSPYHWWPSLPSPARNGRATPHCRRLCICCRCCWRWTCTWRSSFGFTPARRLSEWSFLRFSQGLLPIWLSSPAQIGFWKQFLYFQRYWTQEECFTFWIWLSQIWLPCWLLFSPQLPDT